MTELQKQLFSLADEKYAEFIRKLTPSADPKTFIGVRVPKLRAVAKEFKNTKECEAFLKKLPHKYYEENLLHSILLIDVKDFDELIEKIEAFLPYIDNWAVCDTLRPKAFKKHREELFPYVVKWSKSKEEYTIRFGIDTLMSEYLDEDFDPKYIKIAAGVKSKEYYVQMMVAWYFATALAKQWDDTIPYIESKKLDPWVHNKSIQKAIESYRITEKQKAYLKKLKI